MPKKRDASSRDDYSYERYDEPEGAGASNSMLPSFLAGNGKLIVALVVIIVILAVVGLLLFRGAHSPTPLTDANGNEIQFHGKVDINGNLVREFLSSADANKYTATVNPNEKSTVTLNTRGFLTPGNKRISATITRGGQLTGKSVRLSDGAVVFDENGQLVITIDPEIDLVIKELYPNGVPDGTTLDFNLHIVIFDENTGETTTITVPITYTFSEYMLMAGNCLAVNRTAVSDFTHKGTLEVEMK